MFFNVLKKVQQTVYVAMNSVSQPARVAKHEREKREFAVAAYYDYGIAHMLLQDSSTWEKNVIVMDLGWTCKTVVTLLWLFLAEDVAKIQ